MGEEVRNYKFCPRCGNIFLNGKCGCGWSQSFEINPKWGITEEKNDAFYKEHKYGEITYAEYCKRWDELCQPFIEEVVKKRPEFEPEAYEETLRSIKENREWIEETFAPKMEEKEPRPVSASPTPKITCPYCKSTNTKKLSSLSRAFSAGFFGLGSSKIGKQWHCNSCGSDF